MTAGGGSEPLRTHSASGASSLLDTWSARHTTHLHHRLPITLTASPRGPQQVVSGPAAPSGPNLPALRRPLGCRVHARRRPPTPASAPRGTAPQRCARAAPPRARPGWWNTETLNTGDAQRRARGATQGPAPALVPPRSPCSPARARRRPLPPAPLPAAPEGARSGTLLRHSAAAARSRALL